MTAQIADNRIVLRSWVVCAMMCASAVAHADPADDAKAKWKHGSALYDLGKYDEAIAEFEAAYELDADPAYLFASAQANRLAKHYDRAIDLFQRWADLRPDDPKHADVLATIEDIKKEKAAKQVADKAAADKALADKIAADKAEAERLAAEAAAKKLAAENKHVRIAFDVGFSIVHLVGKEESRSPSIGGRFAVTYTRKRGPWTFDVGGSWQITTLPYDRMDTGHEGEAAAVFYTQVHAIGAVTRTLAGPLWARLGAGVGFANFGGLKKGNPITEAGDGQDNIAVLAARADFAVGYRYTSTIDFTLGVGSASWAGRNKDLSSQIKHTTTLEGLYLGIYIKI